MLEFKLIDASQSGPVQFSKVKHGRQYEYIIKKVFKTRNNRIRAQ